MGLINVKSLSIDTLCDVFIPTTIMCLCLEVYKPFNFTDSKEQECISLGETSSCTIKPRTFCLRTWSHNNTSTIAEAENAGILASLVPNCSSTAT
jgi:hypothetical protein